MRVLFPLREQAKEYMNNEQIATKLVTAMLLENLTDKMVMKFAKERSIVEITPDLQVEILAQAGIWVNKVHKVFKKN